MSIIKKTDSQAYKDTSTVIKVGSKNYKTYKSILVSRSIDDVCGIFNITMSNPKEGPSPFKVGDIINILLSGNQVMRGKIYKTSLEGDASSSDIVLAGRDITGDIIDSTVPDSAKVYSAGINIFNIAVNVVKALNLGSQIIVYTNIRDANAIPAFTADEIISCETGTKAIAFILKYCRKRRLFLNTDGSGNLLFFRADGVRTGNRVINKKSSNENNVISYKVKYSIADRYSKYICKTQDSERWGGEDSAVDANGTALDPDISNTRELEFKLEEGGDSAECEIRANEEANVRRARAFEYTVVVRGFGDVVLWEVNQFVNVFDDKADLSGEFLIKGVEYRIDNNNGRTTKLIIVSSDAYTAEAAVSKRTADKTKAGSKWYSTKAKAANTEDSLKADD